MPIFERGLELDMLLPSSQQHQRHGHKVELHQLSERLGRPSVAPRSAGPLACRPRVQLRFGHVPHVGLSQCSQSVAARQNCVHPQRVRACKCEPGIHSPHSEWGCPVSKCHPNPQFPSLRRWRPRARRVWPPVPPHTLPRHAKSGRPRCPRRHWCHRHRSRRLHRQKCPTLPVRTPLSGT